MEGKERGRKEGKENREKMRKGKGKEGRESKGFGPPTFQMLPLPSLCMQPASYAGCMQAAYASLVWPGFIREQII